MGNIFDALISLNQYPIPATVAMTVAENYGFDPTDEATPEILSSSAFKLAKADIYTWLALAPNISQGGQSYSLSDDQRKQFRSIAGMLHEETDNGKANTIYGYKGSRL